MLLFSPLCPPPLLPLKPFFFLLFYLRSLSEGLTISSSVSLLSWSAAYCLWFAQAHPCGCSFQQLSVTWWIEGDPRRSLRPWATLIFFTWDGLYTHAHYLTRWGGGGGGVWNLNPVVAAGVSWVFAVKVSGPLRHYLRGKEKMDVLPPCFQKFNTSTPTGPLLSSF